MRRAGVYLGLIETPQNRVRMPVWGWLVVGLAVAASLALIR